MQALTRFGQSLLVAAVLAASMPAMAQKARRVAPEQLSNDWILINNRKEGIQVDVPNSGVNLYKPGCVAVTYTIGSDGIPMNIQVAKVTPRSDLGKAAISAVSKFRYGPSLTNKHEDPVSTYYIVPFNSPGDKTRQAAMMAPCKLPGYG
ncbi:energy transducer TonB [Dyella sp. M7H15-1]|uniref:energy transducer TonB n=1 Tax=Dyella sp. M7H15-1 TaxID=2501295 RepID=UPI001004FFDF|nr:energy transducer TonB [Dyella sp. M7H15-1]QAU23663.1 energy transducer TonB [Dyella sp. M7H15-1]